MDELIAALCEKAALMWNASESAAVYDGHRLTRIAAGFNGVVYKATNEDTTIAIKLSRIDERERAQREADALDLMEAAGVEGQRTLLHLARVAQASSDRRVVEGESGDGAEATG